MNDRRFLLLAGYSSLFLGLIHVPLVFLGEQVARFFSAPGFVLVMVQERSPWLFLVVAVLLLVFGLFGAYPLAAAGKLRLRLPAINAGLLAVATIYTLRGLVLIPQLAALARRPHSLPPQVPVFSAVALLVAFFYWRGFVEYRRLSAKTERPSAA